MVPHAHQRGADILNGLLPHTLILPCHLREEGGREGGREGKREGRGGEGRQKERGRKGKEREGGREGGGKERGEGEKEGLT